MVELKKIPITGYFSLVLIFAYNVNQFMIPTLFGFFSEKDGNFSPMALAMIFSIKTIVESSFTILLSLLTSRKHPVLSVTTSALIRVAAFCILSFSHNYNNLILFAIFIGIGGALGRPAIRAVIANQIPHHDVRAKVFGYMHVIMNLGVIIGPLIATQLATNNLNRLGLCIFSLIELVCAIFIYLKIREGQVEFITPPSPQLVISYVTQLKTAFSRKFINLYLTQFFFWMFLSLSIASITLIDQIHPSQSSLRGLLFSTEGFATIICQFIILKTLAQFDSATKYLIASLSFVIGLSMYVASSNPIFLFLGITIFALGDAITGPQINTDLSERISTDCNPSACYATLLTFESCGEALGYIVCGGMLEWRFNHSMSLHSSLILSLFFFFTIFILITQIDRFRGVQYARNFSS